MNDGYLKEMGLRWRYAAVPIEAGRQKVLKEASLDTEKQKGRIVSFSLTRAYSRTYGNLLVADYRIIDREWAHMARQVARWLAGRDS